MPNQHSNIFNAVANVPQLRNRIYFPEVKHRRVYFLHESVFLASAKLKALNQLPQRGENRRDYCLVRPTAEPMCVHSYSPIETYIEADSKGTKILCRYEINDRYRTEEYLSVLTTFQASLSSLNLPFTSQYTLNPELGADLSFSVHTEHLSGGQMAELTSKVESLFAQMASHIDTFTEAIYQLRDALPR